MSLVFVTRCPVEDETALEGACSHDDEPDKVRQFCCRWNLPYSRIFRSIAVYHAGEDPHCETPALKRHGDPFLLRAEEVPPDLQLVCSEDIQQAVLRGMDDPDGERRRVEIFEDMSALLPTDLAGREEALVRALRRRQPDEYVEARMFRALRARDVVRKL
ncbi:MAG TPA: hypothetical protein VKT75_02045 [Acidobacteriaceae bacterium]|nr:hypothetical protein [Acidobacteriaceae bacterium]